MHPLLTHLDMLEPSTYNPREADPMRLELIELSLRKLGWLLPLYADPKGEILSGHQRHLVSNRIGCDMVPVMRVKELTLTRRRALNIMFNRGTNDLDRTEGSEEATKALLAAGVQELADNLPDLAVAEDGFYPCIERSDVVKVADLFAANKGRFIPYATNMGTALQKKGVVMPVVCRKDLHIVNGLGRLAAMSEKGVEDAWVVWVDDDQAEFATAMLNLLTMDFSIHDRYADFLRYGGYRRKRHIRTNLGACFTFAVQGYSKATNMIDLARDADRKKWLGVHGRRVLDFGAGHMIHGKFLAQHGIDCTSFEPFPLDAEKDEISPDRSRAVAAAFLERVADGTKWTSVFNSSVLNAVPFVQDRKHIVTLLASLTAPPASLYLVARSVNCPSWKQVQGRDGHDVRSEAALGFSLDYEDGVILEDMTNHPNVQKFFTAEEIFELLDPLFEDVSTKMAGSLVYSISKNPRPVDLAALKAAIEFEFDLAYPDGTRMGLAETALQAWRSRGFEV